MDLNQYYTSNVRRNCKEIIPHMSAGRDPEYLQNDIYVGVIDTRTFSDPARGLIKVGKRHTFMDEEQLKLYEELYDVTKEEWRYCPGLRNVYQVSSLGRVRYRDTLQKSRRLFKVPVFDESPFAIPYVQGWQELEFEDWNWIICSPLLSGNFHQGSGRISYKVRWLKSVMDEMFNRTVESCGCKDGIMYGGAGFTKYWKGISRPPQNYITQERADFLCLCTFAMNYNYPYKQATDAKNDAEEWMKFTEEERSLRTPPTIVTEQSILHKDGLVWNCTAENLVWVPKFNHTKMKASYAAVRGKGKRGLTAEQAKELLPLLENKYVYNHQYTIKELADRFGVAEITILREAKEFKLRNEAAVIQAKIDKARAAEGRKKNARAAKSRYCSTGEVDCRVGGWYVNLKEFVEHAIELYKDLKTWKKVQEKLELEEHIKTSAGRLGALYKDYCGLYGEAPMHEMLQPEDKRIHDTYVAVDEYNDNDVDAMFQDGELSLD